MNFFDAQDKARRATRWLVVVYILSTALIVAGVTAIVAALLHSTDQYNIANPSILAATAILATLLMVGATVYKTAALSGGGGRVALDMGGTLVPTDVTDPLRRQLRNVVEEMAIASGVPVPEIYVMESESAINAFAAGFSPGDAAVAVTRGTLELLNRAELQGVIAHEFSHILNGDMRLNIRMMGVLFGIMVLGIIGRMILRGSHHTGLSFGRRGKSAGGIMMIGLGLTILGWAGVLMARLIKAAISRQREFLADASAVQFTRQNDGIANALKKIGGYEQHSYLQAADPEEVSHMLFAGGVASFASLFSTHPPIAKRIKALDPSFQERDYPTVTADPIGATHVPDQAAGFAAGSAEFSGHETVSIQGNIADSVGQPSPAHVGYASRLRQSIPETLYAAAHSPSGAYLLTLALVIDKQYADRQINIIEGLLGESRAALVRSYFVELQKIGVSYRLPLLEIAFPVLKQRPAPKLEFLLDLIRRLIEIDGRIDLREFCYYRILARHLQQAIAPAAGQKRNRVSKKAARQAAVDVIRIIADQGHDVPADRDAAFDAGIAEFGQWANIDQAPIAADQSVDKLDQALDILSKINSAGRQSLIKAVTLTVAHDGKLTATEAELLRAICASLDCPLPPLIPTA
jgi:Zn-dependent protease with chaperone function